MLLITYFQIIRSKLIRLYDRAFLKGIGQKNFTGNIFDRFHGLESLFADCEGMSILDVGTSEGLISYEFARRGATTIHGIERERERAWMARRIFRDVPVKSKFICADLAWGADELEKRDGGIFLDCYDIVLFLSVYHHLKRSMTQDELMNLVEYLVKKTGKYFAIRSAQLYEVDSLIRCEGLHLYEICPPKPNRAGPLQIYRRQ